MNKCLDCGKKVSTRKTKRCIICSNKEGHNYIDGRSLKQYYCIDCNREISYPNFLYGNKQCNSCAKNGKNNPNWQDGSSFEIYPINFNNSLKEFIRDRDNHECQLCHIKEIELNRLLSVHHIDYIKENCVPENLISLCKKCHVKTNSNRNYYYIYFKEIIKDLLKIERLNVEIGENDFKNLEH